MPLYATIEIVAKIAMMTITINSSTIVNPRCIRVFIPLMSFIVLSLTFNALVYKHGCLAIYNYKWFPFAAKTEKTPGAASVRSVKHQDKFSRSYGTRADGRHCRAQTSSLRREFTSAFNLALPDAPDPPAQISNLGEQPREKHTLAQEVLVNDSIAEPSTCSGRIRGPGARSNAY